MATGHMQDGGEGAAERDDRTAPSPARRARAVFDTTIKRISAAAAAIVAIAGVPVALKACADKQDKRASPTSAWRRARA